MKDFSLISLADIYGAGLTQKQREFFTDYYERDFSLSEIAENRGVSRQAVRAALKLAEDGLRDYERSFGFCAFLRELEAKLDALEKDGTNGVAALKEWIRSVYGTVQQFE